MLVLNKPSYFSCLMVFCLLFVCGCAGAPMDVPESVAQASSAAERAAETTSELNSEKEKAVA